MYCYKNNELKIHDPFKELWSILKVKGKYIIPPDEQPKKEIILSEEIKIKGKLCGNKKFYFEKTDNDIINKCGSELHLSIDYDYEIQWVVDDPSKKHIKIGFYSPYRKFSADKLYLNFDIKKQKLTKYKCKTGIIQINCNILVVAADKYYDDININLLIKPINRINNSLQKNLIDQKLGYYGLKIFDIKTEGLFYRHIIKKKFKKLYHLIRDHYELTSIYRDNYFKIKSDYSPIEIDYKNIKSKNPYGLVFSLTTEMIPISDKNGDFGIIIKHNPNIVTSATIYYELKISNNIYKTSDIIVWAAYYGGDGGYIVHQIYDKNKKKDVYVMNKHKGPYPNNNQFISGELDLESTANDITLLIGNSLYGILPEHGENCNKLIEIIKFEVKYFNIKR